MITPETFERHAIYGGTTWLKRAGLTARFSKDERMVCTYLPRKKPITLGRILQFDGISVDWMITIIEAGGFLLPGQDWRSVLRNTLALRLKANRGALATPPFDKIVDQLLEYQLEGGKLSVRDSMTDLARKVLLHPQSTDKQCMIAKLIFSICHETEAHALTKSFHWLKMALAMEEQFPAMGVQLYKKEDAAMKAALIQILAADD